MVVRKGVKIYVVGVEDERRAGTARGLSLLGSTGRGCNKHTFYLLEKEPLDWIGEEAFYPINEEVGEFLVVEARKKKSRFIRFGEEGGPGQYDGAVQVETRIVSLANLIDAFEFSWEEEEELQQQVSILSRLIRYGKVKYAIRRIFDRRAAAVIDLFRGCLGPDLEPDREDIIAAAGLAAAWLGGQSWVRKAYLYGSTAELLAGEPRPGRYPRDIDFLVDTRTTQSLPALGREPHGYDVIKIGMLGYHEPSILPVTVRFIREEDMPKEDEQFVLSVCAGPLWTWGEGKFVLAEPPPYFGC